MDHTADQSPIRRNGLRARRALSDLQRLSYSLRIADRLERLPVFRSARCVAVYLSSWDEVDTSEIILRSWRANKRVVAPVIKNKSHFEFAELAPQTRLRNNIYGLQEPASSRKVAKHDIDIVITPLAAFDAHAARVGMGGGYYDRFFSSLATRHSYFRPRLVGVAFACQQSTKIPENPWDIPLYACITENRTHAF
ncbi:MAG: 5-formyltetrahydrofolate cyclo-ligase [Pseudomonadota bacterium]